MPERATLKAEKRAVLGKEVRRLRRQGILPGNVFGNKEHAPVAVQVDAHEFDRMLKTHGRTTLYRLVISPDGGEETVLVRHIDREPVTGAIQHIDFMHVEMNQPLRVKVPIHLTGVPPAIKEFDGVLLHQLDAVEIEALPANLPEALTLDVSGMTELNTPLYVRDIAVPSRVTLLTPEDEAVVTVTPPRVAPVEEEAPAAAATAEEPAAAEQPEEAES
jgi:large subunit ribosomal protein L25